MREPNDLADTGPRHLPTESVFSSKEILTSRIISVYKLVLSSQLAFAPKPCRNSIDLIDILLSDVFPLEDLRDLSCDKTNRAMVSSFPEDAPDLRDD